MNNARSNPTHLLPKWFTARRGSLSAQPIDALPVCSPKQSSGVHKSSSNRVVRPIFELSSPSDPETETFKQRLRYTKSSASKFAPTAEESEEREDHYAINGAIIETEADTIQCSSNKEAASAISLNEANINKSKRVGHMSGPESTHCSLTPTRNTAAGAMGGFRLEDRRGSMPEILLHRIKNHQENSFIINGSEAHNPRSAHRLSQLPRAIFSK